MEGIRTILTTGAHTAEPRKDVHDEFVAKQQAEIAQMVWAHWSVKHSHFKNPDGKVFTLSPWPIPTYWNWTKRFDPDDYVLT
jgi:4-hydroxyacetophenone monooxygenase